MSLLTVSGLSAGYGKQNIIKDISFQLEEGTLMGIIGANGSGKTTLLKAICGILPHQGTATLKNTTLEKVPPKQLAKLVSYIPQRSGISIDISTLDVVLMGFNPQLGLLAHPTTEMKKMAMLALEQVGLAGKDETNYLHLSEGQKQLCILARTLVSDSKLLLLDEPESSLDFRFRHQMLSMLHSWVASQNRSSIVTLHDPTLALNFCDKLLLLYEGGILDIIDPKADSLDKLEHTLSAVYGGISLQQCYNRKGEAQIIMLKEDDV